MTAQGETPSADDTSPTAWENVQPDIENQDQKKKDDDYDYDDDDDESQEEITFFKESSTSNLLLDGTAKTEDALQLTSHDSSTQDDTMVLSKDGDNDDDDSSGLGSKPSNHQLNQHHHRRENFQYFLRWSRLMKTVQVQEKRTGLIRGSIAGPQESNTNGKKGGPVDKTILNQVSGYAAPGQVMALIGPSGSSKTTLLNTLSGRGGIDSGEITVNGRPFKNFLSKTAYVRQEDIFFEHLTVRDQLAYTAFLRMPQEWSRESKLEAVDEIIRSLRLRKVQGSQINMLSGGEKKRVNIGTELLTNPSCLLLDEPTSGLDSTSAAALVKLLQNLAATQSKTVIMSIHQPSSGMFLDFDSLMMLAEGNVVYFGSPEGSIQYLKELDFPCREGYNIADHWMDLLVSDSAMEEEEEYMKSSYFSSTDLRNSASGKGGNTGGSSTSLVRNRKTKGQLAREEIRRQRRSTRQQLIEAWDSESMASKIDAARKEDSKNASATETKISSKYNTGWWTQYRVLMHRALKNSRSDIFTPLNMIKSGILGVITGLLWFQLEYTEKTVLDRTSYFFFTMTYWVFEAMFGSILAFPLERKVILKERASASYHLSAYFMAKTTSEAPTRLSLPLLYMAISFWLAGISSRFALFVYTTFISLLSVLAGESYGLLVGASVDRTDHAMTCITVLALSMMLLGGFYVENVPGFVSWAKYLSPFKYAFDASRAIVFDKPVPCDGSGALQDLCNQGQESVSPEDLSVFLEVDGSLGFNIGMLVVLGMVPRYFAYLALKSKKDRGRG